MYLEVIERYSLLFLKYIIFYTYFYIFGQFIFSKILNFVAEKKKINNIFYIKSEYLFPLIGIVFIGNILIIFNFFFPLKYSNILLTLIFILSLSSQKGFNLNFKKFLIFENIFSYIFIPGILIISTYDTAFNFDAGYYSIPNQSWLRESNIIIGIVNIYWELGILSITEYISAALWFDSSFVLLHLYNIYFIHFFYLLLKEFIFNKNEYSLMNISLFLLFFSIFDNFGFGGGRNGYVYIEGVTKQDVPIGILFWFLSIVILKKIIDKSFREYEVLIISLLCFFVYEIKLSGVLIMFIYFLLLLFLIKNNSISIKRILFLNIPLSIFLISWLSKSFFTTGCFVYPLDFTCLNRFEWYISGSTLDYATIAKAQSQPYDFSIPFREWVIQSGTHEVRKQVFINFIISLLILYILKLCFFNKKKYEKNITILCFSYILINLLYLFFFGPIARYFIGICLFIVSLLGIYAGKPKFQISETFKYSFIIFSIILLVKSTSYLSLMQNNEFKIFDPRINQEIEYVPISLNWVTPRSQDLQCWAKIYCTPVNENIVFIKKGNFITAFKH